MRCEMSLLFSFISESASGYARVCCKVFYYYNIASECARISRPSLNTIKNKTLCLFTILFLFYLF